MQLVVRDHVLRLARGHPRLAFIPLDGPGPTTANESVNYREFSGSGVDTILEVSVRNIRLASLTGGINPPVELRVEARARLIRAQDGVEIYAETLQGRTGAAIFTEWAANDAKLFREWLDLISIRLAKDVVLLLFEGDAAVDARAHLE